jgi:hypothetical protein
MAQDWSKYIPPERAIELAGKWKHGWIPLDATAVSAKMKGRTGGKRWWDKGGSSGGNRKVVGVPKKGTKSRKEGLRDTVSSEALTRKGGPAIPRSGRIHSADNGRRVTSRMTPSEAAERGLSRKSGSMLTSKEVPRSKPKKRPSIPTAGGKPIDTTKRRLTGDGKAVRTLGNDADTLADNYVRMHGTDGARKKLAALKANKSKDPRKRELIAALERKVGGQSGKSVAPSGAKRLTSKDVPGAAAGKRRETFHSTRPSSAERIEKEGFRPSGQNGAFFGQGVYSHTKKEDADQYREEIRNYLWGDEVTVRTQTKVKNPFVIKDDEGRKNPSRLVHEALVKAGHAKPGERLLPEEITRRLQAAGYDGVELKQPGYNPGSAGNQILSFNPKDTRLRPKLKTEKVIKLRSER